MLVIKKIILLSSILLLLQVSYPSSAGMLNFLTKLSKTSKDIDVELPLNKLMLPDEMKGLSALNIKLDVDGQWNVIQRDGTRITIDKLVKQQSTSSKHGAFVVRESGLPKHLQQFNNIPHDWPVLIQGKKGRLFELHRGNPSALIYKKVRLTVSNISDIKDGLWMLQRPAVDNTVRLFQIENHSTSVPFKNIYGSRASIESIAVNQLMDTMRLLRNQTLVVSGRVVNGKLLAGTHKTSYLSIKKIQQLADENDIHLVVIDSDRPKQVLKNISQLMEKAVKNNTSLYQSMGDFFDRLKDSSNPGFMELITSRSGNNQFVIQWINRDRVETGSITNKSAEIIMDVPVHILLHSVIMQMPDRERSRELDARIIPNVSSWITFYIIMSTVLGFVALGSSWILWRKIWRLEKRNEYKYLIGFVLSWTLHRILFILLFIPVLGTFSFIWMILSVFYKVIYFIVFKPARWLYQRC